MEVISSIFRQIVASIPLILILISLANVDYNNSDESSWAIKIIYITTMNTFSKRHVQTFSRLGISYLSDSAKIRMNQDGFMEILGWDRNFILNIFNVCRRKF